MQGNGLRVQVSLCRKGASRMDVKLLLHDIYILTIFMSFSQEKVKVFFNQLEDSELVKNLRVCEETPSS